MRARVRRLWARVERGDYHAAVEIAAPDMHFHFVGDAAPAAEFRGRDEFERWFGKVFEFFPGIRLSLTDLVVTGWPWDTTVVARLSIAATLADGTPYSNQGVQWVRLRWGRMVDDYVLEDTARLAAAVGRQRAVTGGPPA